MEMALTLLYMPVTPPATPTPGQTKRWKSSCTSAECWWETSLLDNNTWSHHRQRALLLFRIMTVLWIMWQNLACLLSSMMPRPIQNISSSSSNMSMYQEQTQPKNKNKKKKIFDTALQHSSIFTFGFTLSIWCVCSQLKTGDLSCKQQFTRFKKKAGWCTPDSALWICLWSYLRIIMQDDIEQHRALFQHCYYTGHCTWSLQELGGFWKKPALFPETMWCVIMWGYNVLLKWKWKWNESLNK